MRSRRLMCKSPGRMNLLGVLVGLLSAVLPAIASGAAVTIVCGGVVGSFEHVARALRPGRKQAGMKSA